MSTSARRQLRIGGGIVAMAVLAVAVTVGAMSMGRDDKLTVTAMFKDASPLVQGNLVKMDGVQVGEVSSITLDDGHAEVQMSLDPAVAPLHQDASATIRPLSLLGERYLDLKRGSNNKPDLSNSDTIPESRTHRSTDLQDVLNSLNDPTSTALASLVTTLGEGSNGQGRNIGAALKALAPAMQNTRQLGDVLDQQNEVLGSLVDQASPVAKALAGNHGAELDRLVGSAHTTLSSVSAQRAALSTTLRQLPGTLRQAQRTLGELTGASDAATPALRAARPVTDNLPEITKELNAFANSADPAMASLPPVLHRADQLLDQAAPLVRDLRPGGRALSGVSASANRIVGDLSKKFTTVLDFVKFWALSTNGKDGLSNYFRGQIVDTPQALLQAPGVALGNGKKAPPTPQRPPGAPLPVDGTPPFPPGPSQPGGPTVENNRDGNSATGLDNQQEQSLVQQLLGGQ